MSSGSCGGHSLQDRRQTGARSRENRVAGSRQAEADRAALRVEHDTVAARVRLGIGEDGAAFDGLGDRGVQLVDGHVEVHRRGLRSDHRRPSASPVEGLVVKVQCRTVDAFRWAELDSGGDSDSARLPAMRVRAMPDQRPRRRLRARP